MFTLEGSVIHQRGLNVNRVSRKKKLSTGQHVIRWRAAASERIMGITSFGAPFLPNHRWVRQQQIKLSVLSTAYFRQHCV